jgi:tRNA U55 pseudouridine synthase TruB
MKLKGGIKVGHGGTLDPLASGVCRLRWARRPS